MKLSRKIIVGFAPFLFIFAQQVVASHHEFPGLKRLKTVALSANLNIVAHDADLLEVEITGPAAAEITVTPGEGFIQISSSRRSIRSGFQAFGRYGNVTVARGFAGANYGTVVFGEGDDFLVDGRPASSFSSREELPLPTITIHAPRDILMKLEGKEGEWTIFRSEQELELNLKGQCKVKIEEIIGPLKLQSSGQARCEVGSLLANCEVTMSGQSHFTATLRNSIETAVFKISGQSDVVLMAAPSHLVGNLTTSADGDSGFSFLGSAHTATLLSSGASRIHVQDVRGPLKETTRGPATITVESRKGPRQNPAGGISW
jgi:hypothetical protein